ncbi:MAG: ABC transporter ATP-binding protein [Anaerolineales bacterium]|nr:ABC transporter ATP-binding protein [Anaerolineales bacterium]
MSTIVIQTQGLSKHYGDFVALRDLNLTVYAGEIFGYLGPNGAGKTTTIRTLLDIIRPSAGSATIFSKDIRQDSVKIHAQLGYLPSEMTFYENMTARQYVRFLERARRTSCMAEAERLAQRLDFDLNRSLEGLSTGNKRKIGIITTLMHRPPLLILDEPTSGLDPLMQQVFNELVREVQNEGRTIFLSSHNLNEVQALCDRVGILRQGELTDVESVDKLTRLSFRWVHLEFAEAVDARAFEQLSGVSHLQADTTKVKLQVTGDMDALIKLAAQHTICDIRVEDPTLEEIFLKYYGRDNA